MKGLDTPVLLDILEGRPSARKLLRRLAGEEICTTEANLLELESIARRERGGSLDRRLAAVERLRRGLTVLPLDERATRTAASRMRGVSQGVSGLGWLIFGALETNGCGEWFTRKGAAFPAGTSKLKVSYLAT
jgi:predicted nucleic acid-binding protein